MLHKCLYDKLIIIHQVIYILTYVCLSVFWDLGLVPVLIAGTWNFNIQNYSSGLPIFTREKDWLRHSNFRLLLWFHRATGVSLGFFFFCVNVDINFKMERHTAGRDSLVVKIDCYSFEDLKSQHPRLMAHTTLTQFQGIYYPLLLIISSGQSSVWRIKRISYNSLIYFSGVIKESLLLTIQIFFTLWHISWLNIPTVYNSLQTSIVSLRGISCFNEFLNFLYGHLGYLRQPPPYLGPHIISDETVL